MKKKNSIISISLLLILSLSFYIKFPKNSIIIDSETYKVNSNVLAVYLKDDEEYTSSKIFPSKTDGYRFNHAECKDTSTTLTWNNSLWAAEISSMIDGEISCKLYFDKEYTPAKDYILSNITTIDTRNSISNVLTETTTGVIYETEDDYGTSYYYAGDTRDNYFYFAGYYWRIIRINGDGTIRLIYQGTTATSSGMSAGIDSSAFNSPNNDNTYLGFMYGTSGSNTYKETHENTNDSSIKSVLDSWYVKNLKDYENDLDFNQGFCNDRTVSQGNRSGYGSLGYGINATAYGATDRVFSSSNWNWLSELNPTFKCSQTNDWFTTTESNAGNHALTYPIGLITMDEIIYAGGYGATTNYDYYLYTGDYYWTMTPYYFYGTSAYPFGLNSNGGLDFAGTTAGSSKTVRPVINIDKEVELEGTGTQTDPYKIIGTEIKTPAAKENILSHYSTILTRDDFSVTVTDTTTGTIYKSLNETQYDNDGEVYYFAGNPTDNWIYFGGFYWRIIRINGDGTIRLIYNGNSTESVGENTYIQFSEFNTLGDDNAYIGYMYGTPRSSTYEATHANINNSTAKTVVDEWYDNNLKTYETYIDSNAGFCGDRSIYSGTGIGATETYYAAYNRLYNTLMPSFKCTNSNDLYKINIGLISADEVAFAGGVADYTAVNQSYYLYNSQNTWTMTPYRAIDNNSSTLFVISNSLNVMNTLTNTGGVIRPVINLKADVHLTGSGTIDDPYIIN